MKHINQILKSFDINNLQVSNRTGRSSSFETFEWFYNRTTSIEVVARLDESRISIIVREWISRDNVLRDVITLYIDSDIFVQKSGLPFDESGHVTENTQYVSELSSNEELYFQRSTVENIRYTPEEYGNVVQVLTDVYNTVLKISKES